MAEEHIIYGSNMSEKIRFWSWNFFCKVAENDGGIIGELAFSIPTASFEGNLMYICSSNKKEIYLAEKELRNIIK